MVGLSLPGCLTQILMVCRLRPFTQTAPIDQSIGAVCFPLKEVPIEQMDKQIQLLIQFYRTINNSQEVKKYDENRK